MDQEPGRFLIRPTQKSDLEAILDIAAHVGPGFTSLPYDKQNIENKIKRSLASFNQELEKQAGYFLFVLEDTKQKKIAGTAALEAKVSYQNPFYNYTIMSLLQSSSGLKQGENIEQEHRILFLGNQYQDASLFCSLYLHPE